MARFIPPKPGLTYPFTANTVASDGDTVSRYVSNSVGITVDEEEAERLARAGWYIDPPNGSVERVILDLLPSWYSPLTPEYGFNDISGSAAGARAATTVGSPSIVSGHAAGLHPGAAALDGADDYIEAPWTFRNDVPVTLMAVVKRDSTGTDDVIFGSRQP